MELVPSGALHFLAPRRGAARRGRGAARADRPARASAAGEHLAATAASSTHAPRSIEAQRQRRRRHSGGAGAGRSADARPAKPGDAGRPRPARLVGRRPKARAPARAGPPTGDRRRHDARIAPRGRRRDRRHRSAAPPDARRRRSGPARDERVAAVPAAASARSSRCSSCCWSSRPARTAYLGVVRSAAAAQGRQHPAADRRNGDRAARHDHRPQRRRPRGLRAGATTSPPTPTCSATRSPRPSGSRRCSARAQASVLRKLSERTGFVYLARAPSRTARPQRILALKIPGITRHAGDAARLPARLARRAGARRRGHRRHGLAGIEYSADAAAARALRQAARRQRRDRPADLDHRTAARVPGQDVALTLDANIQQRTEDVLGAVAQVFNPKDATAIVMDPRTGAILALANWPRVERQRPRRAPAGALQDRAVGFNYEPGSTFKAVTVSGALAGRAVTPRHAVQHPRPDPGRRPHDPRRTEHGEETLTTAQILAQSSNVGAIKIGMLRGRRRASTTGCTASASARRRASTCRARSGASSLAARPVLGLLDRQPADRPGRVGHADADGDRLRGDRQRRASCARRTSSRASAGGRRAAAGRAPHLLAAPGGVSCGTCSKACSRPGGTAQRGPDPRLRARRQDRHGEQGRPRNGRLLEDAPTSRRSSASRRRPTRSCSRRSSSTNRRPARSTAAGSRRRRWADHGFALPYLGIPPELSRARRLRRGRKLDSAHAGAGDRPMRLGDLTARSARGAAPAGAEGEVEIGGSAYDSRARRAGDAVLLRQRPPQRRPRLRRRRRVERGRRRARRRAAARARRAGGRSSTSSRAAMAPLAARFYGDPRASCASSASPARTARRRPRSSSRRCWRRRASSAGCWAPSSR